MKFQNINKRQNGFTLVELAIVITIIGILIGGVLKGQQLIDQARLAGTVSQINGYRTAFSIFKTTYNEIPGDMVEPDARIVGCDGCKAETGTPGNGWVGDGYIDGSWGARKTEQNMFWLHLYKAGMISGVSDASLNGNAGVGESFPAAKIGGGFLMESGTTCGSNANYQMWGQEDNCAPHGHIIFIHAAKSSSYLSRNYMIMTPMSAAGVDRKLDDSRPLTGVFAACPTGRDITAVPTIPMLTPKGRPILKYVPWAFFWNSFFSG